MIQPGSVVEKGLVVGAIIGGRYELRALLGEGGMGAVFLAHDEVLGTDVALKFVPRDLAHREQDLRRLRAEVLLAQKASHPNVCRTYDLEEIDGFLFIKMEYVAGETLACQLRRLGRLAIEDLIDLALMIAAGLEAAHAQGVVHCDLKPENILIEHGTKRPVLMDFGIARAAARVMNYDQPVWGTPAYMAPEQLLEGSVDARADLYSLGCVLYQLAVGEVPYPHVTTLADAEKYRDEPVPDPRARRRELPLWLSTIIRQLMVKDPRHRFPSAAALHMALLGPRHHHGTRGWGVAAAALFISLGVAIGAYRLTNQRAEWHPESRLRQPAYEEHAGAPNISPDGRWLAYISDREGAWRLYVEPLGGGPARTLKWEGLLYPVRWAHDSKSLLGVVYQTNRVVRIPLSDGQAQEIASSATDVADCQGRLVLCTRGDDQCPTCPHLMVQEKTGEGSRWRELRSLPKTVGLRPMRCDPSGRRLTFSALPPVWNSGVWQGDVYVLDMDEDRLRKLTSDAYDNDFPNFAPDGQTIIYSSNRSGSHELWEVPAGGGKAMRLTSGGSYTKSLPFDISPDGKLLIYNQESEADQLYAHPLGSSDRFRRINHPLSYRLWQPHVTLDGSHLVILRTREEKSYAVVLPIRGGEDRVLSRADAVTLSVDGTEVIYAVNEKEGARVLAMSLGGGEARRITQAPGPVTALAADNEGWVHLSIYQGRHHGGWRAPLAGGEVTREPAQGATVVLPAPAGGWRLVGFEGPNLWKYRWRLVAPGRPLDDPQARSFEAGKSVAWAKDGRSFFIWTGSEVHRLFVARNQDEVILRTDQLNGMAVSHDTKTLFVVETTGHTVRQVITNFGERLRPIP
ncbi:MAG TPA: protein kinase [Polyangia bacterium]|nr:protein kinase [Polyangia bacterium]